MSDVDWPAVRIAFEDPGKQSVRAIGRAHSVSHTAVAKRAAAEGWRDPRKSTPVLGKRPRRSAVATLTEAASKQLPGTEPPRLATPQVSNDEMPSQHRVFVVEFLKDMNATQAAIRAGYSPASAHVTGPRLLDNAAVKAAINAAIYTYEEEAEIDRFQVRNGLRQIARSDPRKLFDEEGRLKPIHEMDDETALSIASVEVVSRQVAGGEKGQVEHVSKIKLWDKLKAHELLARHRGMLIERKQVEQHIVHIIEQMSPDERLARAAALAQKVLVLEAD